MRSLRLVAVLAIPAHVVFAQQAPRGSTLTLDDAIGTARQNNPQYQQTANLLRSSDAQVRAAYGQLLPQANASFRTSYNQGGTQYVQGIPLPSSDSYNS